MSVREDEVINPGGGKNLYGHVHFKNRAVAILPLDEDGNTWLVGQHRYTLDAWSWELPMGGAPLDEDMLIAAQRELREETGLAGKIDMLLGVSANPSALYHTVLMVGYLVKSYSGNLIAGDDANDAAHFHYNKLPEIAFESHTSFIRMYYAAYSA